MTTTFIEAGTVCHNCGDQILKGRPIVVGCPEHGQHVYHDEGCLKNAVAVHP